MKTIKKLCLLLAAIALSSVPAFAQAWGPDGAQAVSYPTSSGGAVYAGVLGDGSNARGGTPPATAYEPAAIPTAGGIVVADWISNTGIQRTSSSGAEAKFRIPCVANHEAMEDPIVYPGQAMVGHDHTFIGNAHTDRNSNYASLRGGGPGEYSCPGGPLNKTGYWEPNVKKALPSGRVVSLRPDFLAFYYVITETAAPTITRLFNDLNFIGGVSPTDPNNTARLAEMPAGFSISFTAGVNGTGFHGWLCETTMGAVIQTPDLADYYPTIVKTDGTDPWAGACNAGKQLVAVATAPQCWDGHNLHSPNGRGHFRYLIRHDASGLHVCPDHWFQIPSFEVKSAFSHNGFADYSTWYLSSDRMDPNPANWLTNGRTFHFDWWGGWDETVRDTFLVHCLGVVVPGVNGGVGDPASCSFGTISATQRLIVEAPPVSGWSKNPTVDDTHTYFDEPNSARYFPLKAGTRGPFHMQHVHP